MDNILYLTFYFILFYEYIYLVRNCITRKIYITDKYNS